MSGLQSLLMRCGSRRSKAGPSATGRPREGGNVSDLIEHLRSFNRKERFILLKDALGQHTFSLDASFRERLRAIINVDVPSDAFVAMDYHLDWLQMALFLDRTPNASRVIPKPESTDRSLTGRDAGLAESSAGVPASAGRCRAVPERGAVAQRGSGALRARARGCARRGRACWREPRTRAGAVSGPQAGSGSARNRARAAAHCPAQGQRFGRCRVQRRAEWVSRPARAK